MKVISIISTAVLAAILLFSCGKEELTNTNSIEDVTAQQKRMSSFTTVSKVTDCFTATNGMWNLSGHHVNDFPPFAAAGDEGTLDAGVDCFLEEQGLCDETLTDHEIVTINTESWPQFDFCDIYCQTGDGGSFSNDDQTAILESALALANANAPICSMTGEPKVVSDIDFGIGFTGSIPGSYFFSMHVQYSCCAEEVVVPNCPTAMMAQGLEDGEVVTVTSSSGVVTTFNTTDYTTLVTGTQYTFNIPQGATVTICSCGENYTTLSAGAAVPFTTSNNPTSYSMCAF